MRRRHHPRIAGEQMQKPLSAKEIERGEDRCQPRTPAEDAPYAEAQRTEVGGADIFARQGFAGEGKTVHHEREEQKQLHQQGVDGKDHRPVGRSGLGEP